MRYSVRFLQNLTGLAARKLQLLSAQSKHLNSFWCFYVHGECVSKQICLPLRPQKRLLFQSDRVPSCGLEQFHSRNFLLGEKGHRSFFISLKIFVCLRARDTQTLSSTHVVSKLWLRRAYEECFCRLHALANKMLRSSLLVVGGYTSCCLCLWSSRLL